MAYTAGLEMKDLVELAGRTRTTLNYWKRKGLFEAVPESRENPNRIGRRYDLKAAQIVLSVVRLRDAGVSLQKVRKVAQELQDYEDDLATAVLWTDGKDVYRIENESEVLENLNRGGQLEPKRVVVFRDVAEEAREFYRKRKAA